MTLLCALHAPMSARASALARPQLALRGLPRQSPRRLSPSISHARRAAQPVASSVAAVGEPRPEPARALVDAGRTVGSLGLITGIDRALAALFTAAGIGFPPTLFGMAGVFALLCAVRAQSESLAEALAGVLRPGCAWLTRWMAVFFAPSLVALPAVLAAIGPAEAAKLPVILLSGFFLTLFSTAAMLKAVPATAGDVSAAGPPAVRTGRPLLVPALSAAWVASAAAVCARRAAEGALAPSCAPVQLLLGCTTVLLFRAAELLPARVRAVAHPTLLAAGGTLAFATATARAVLAPAAAGTAAPGVALLAAYASRAAGALGGGGLLASILPLTVLGLALQLYDRRAQLAQEAPRIAISGFSGLLTGIVATGLLGRALGLSGGVARALLPRCVTAPLAHLSATALGANSNAAVGAVVLTGLLGANFGQQLLRAVGVTDAVCVGLCMGTSAHGLGTAALSAWPEALAFSAIALAINGLLTASLLVSPLGQALARMLLGA